MRFWGACVQGDCGNLIFGFTSNIVSCSIITTELQVISLGLQQVVIRGFNNIIESDSLAGINLIRPGALRNILFSIWSLPSIPFSCRLRGTASIMFTGRLTKLLIVMPSSALVFFFVVKCLLVFLPLLAMPLWWIVLGFYFLEVSSFGLVCFPGA